MRDDFLHQPGFSRTQAHLLEQEQANDKKRNDMKTILQQLTKSSTKSATLGSRSSL